MKIIRAMLAPSKAASISDADLLGAGHGGGGEAGTIIDPRLQNQVTYIPSNATDDAAVQIKKYQHLATQMVEQSVVLIVEPKDAKTLATVLRESRATLGLQPPVTEGMSRTYDIGIYDVKMCGEVVTHPHLRVMSFRAEHYAKMIGGFTRSFLPEGADTLSADNFGDSIMVLAFDGGKHLDGNVYNDAFKVAGKTITKKNVLYVHLSEASLEQRRDRMKIITALSLHSFEQGHIYTKDAIQVEFRKREHYPGSSVSSGIGPVTMVADSSPLCWYRTFEDKKAIYGKSNRVAPGGRTPGIDNETAKKILRKDKDLEPVFYYTMPKEFYIDIFKPLGGHSVTMLTVGDGSGLLAAMEANLPVIGICFTDQHLNDVKLHLANQVFAGFQTEGSAYYRADFAKELSDAGVAPNGTALTDLKKAEKEKELEKKQNEASKKRLDEKRKASAVEDAGGNNTNGGTPAAKAAGFKKAKHESKQSVADKMKQALAALSGDGNIQDLDGDNGESSDGGE